VLLHPQTFQVCQLHSASLPLGKGDIFIYRWKGFLMIKTGPLFASVIVALAACIATPASAGGTTVYLARAGTGTAGTGCTLATPCAFMGYALTAAGVGGEVICLDKGNYDTAVTIQQSVTISCGDDLWEAHGAVTISAPAGLSVSIEGLVIDGNGLAGTGVTFSGQGSLRLRRVRIGDLLGSNSTGLLFQPSGAAKLEVSDSVFYSNGTGTGGGIVINPASGGVAQVALEHVTVTGNAFGIAADGSRSTDGINMTIADSMVAGNSQDGIIAVTQSGGAPIGVMVTNTKSVNNAIGIRSIGTGVTVRVKNSDIMGNGTGLSFSGGGILATYGNNAVNANGVNGAFSGSIPLQ
jgi:hypothetical protein